MRVCFFKKYIDRQCTHFSFSAKDKKMSWTVVIGKKQKRIQKQKEIQDAMQAEADIKANQRLQA